ncbi:MAG: PmoA family protein [Saprospiraceae bacterium]|nr:PmoA family protein [Saprospiraceae bacterium]
MIRLRDFDLFIYEKVLGFFVCSLFVATSAMSQVVRFEQHESQIDIMAGDHLMASYRYGNHLSKPVLHPLMSPSGEMITRNYPFKDIEGESHDHPHHTGVSFTYGSNNEVNGTSFWANPHDMVPLTMLDKLPQIRHIGFLRKETGSDTALIQSINHWINKDNKPVLEEKRTMLFRVDQDEFSIDFTFEMTAIDTTVTFEDTKEGMFAIRVADWLAEDANGTLYTSTGKYLNAEGEETEKNIWGKQSAWVNLEGKKDNRPIGMTIFHHPSSLNFPTFWHARGYGCFAANPIGRYDYEKGRGLKEPKHRTLVIQPGDTAIFRFRMMIYEGSRNKAMLDGEFVKYGKE